MNIESTGQFNSNIIFNMAIDRYKYILNKIKEDIIDKKGAIVEFHRNTRTAGIRLILKNETETVGNILTQYILDMDKDIICGYTQHHTFEKYIFIDINYKNNTFNQIRELFIKVIDKINKILDDLKKDFEGSSTKKIPKKKESKKKRNHKKLNQHWMIMKIPLHLKKKTLMEDDDDEVRHTEPLEVDSSLNDEETINKEDVDSYLNEDKENNKSIEEPKEVDSTLNDDEESLDETTDEEEEEPLKMKRPT